MPARRASVPAASGSTVAVSSAAAAAAAAAAGGGGGGGNAGGLGMLPGGAMSLHESFIYNGAGWQGPANYAVVAAAPPPHHHRSVCRYSSYPGKQPASGADGNYEDVWACRLAAVAAAASASAATTAAAAAAQATTTHSPAKSHLPTYLLGGHAPLSRCKTWSPPDVDGAAGSGCRPVLTAAVVDDAASVSNCSDTSGSSGSTMLATFNVIRGSSRRGGSGSGGGGGGTVSVGSSSAASVAAAAAGAEQSSACDESTTLLLQSGCNDHELTHSPASHSVPPPRLAPFSGFLLPITEKGVLRPVACRPAPAARPNEYVAAPPPPPPPSSKLQPPAQPHAAQLLLAAAASAQPSSVAAASSSSSSSYVDEGYWSRETSRSSCVSSAGAAAALARSSGAPQSTSADGDAGSSGPPSPTSRSPCTAAIAAYGAVVAPVGGGGPAASRSAPPPVATTSEAQQQQRAASRELDYLATQSLLLREREAEVDGLRETLERNERAIFAAFDERQASWQRQMRDVSAEYQRRLAAQQERAAKCEAGLVAQLQRAQQEVDALQDELRLCRARPDDAELQQQQRRPLAAAHPRIAAAEHDAVAAAAGSAVARLRLDDAAAAAGGGGGSPSRADAADDRFVGAAHKRYKEDGKPAAATSSTGSGSSSAGSDEGSAAAAARAEAERLRTELERRNCELKALREGIEAERLLWQQEKDKVIQYQKQLQLNYVQMYRKNAQLESELSRLLAAATADPAAAGQHQQLPRRDCVAASRGAAPGPALVLSFADNPESLC